MVWLTTTCVVCGSTKGPKGKGKSKFAGKDKMGFTYQEKGGYKGRSEPYSKGSKGKGGDASAAPSKVAVVAGGGTEDQGVVEDGADVGAAPADGEGGAAEAVGMALEGASSSGDSHGAPQVGEAIGGEPGETVLEGVGEPGAAW